MASYITYCPESTVSGDSQFMISEYDLLPNTNTFDIEALDKTLDYLGVKCFRSLYKNQRNRIHMDRFDFTIDKFIPEYRTQYENHNRMYSRRYIRYVDRPFIHYSQVQAFRSSEFYRKELNQEVVGKHTELFAWNFLIFVNGELVTTCEVLPLEAKTGVIIDLESPADKHGVTYEQYAEWMKNKAVVSVIFVPNFVFTDSVNVTRAHLVTNMNREISPDYVSPIENNDMDFKLIDETSLVFHNNPTDLHVKRLSTSVDIYDQHIAFGDMTEFRETPTIDLSFITFNKELIIKRNVKGKTPFFKLDVKMPCPKDHLLIFVVGADGYTKFGYNIEVKEYYHNMYELIGLEDNERAIIYIFYTEKGVEHSETYFRQIALYEEYYSILIQAETKTLPPALRDYVPLHYNYDELNYQKYHCEVTPAVYSYKIDKLRYAIEEDPWTLWAYLLFLKFHYHKMFVYMENIELGYRARENTYHEPIDHNCDVVFDEPHYLFSVNKSFISGKNWRMRLFLDGLLLYNNTYVVREGMDYHYIYIPTRLVKEDSVLEIERHRAYDHFKEKVFVSTADTYNLILDPDLAKVVLAYDVYLVDMETNKYLTKDDYTIGIKMLFVNSKKQLVEGYRDIDVKCHKYLGTESHIRIKNRKFLNRRIQIGIHRTDVMEIGEEYVNEPFSTNCYLSLYVKNQANYTKSSFRVFKNGRYCLPVEYRMIDRDPGVFGGRIEIQTLVGVVNGDRLAIDHVPADYRVIYYQETVDRDGYVDLDGKIHLPISLRWYDVYLNGIRLSPKNIKIISPTRFYLINVNSLSNLVIVDRDRDDDVFFLQPHIVYDDGHNDDRNNTLIDDLFDQTDIRDKIDDDLPPIDPIDPPNPGPIIDPDCIDMIIFFEEYMKYTHIDPNYCQLDYDDVKEKFPMIMDEGGVCHIDGNVHPYGEYILRIDGNECNTKRIGPGLLNN